MSDIFSDDDDPDLSPEWLTRSRANELAMEALLENELAGNNWGARVGHQELPDEPAFCEWLGEFSRYLPSYVQLTWDQMKNNRYAGYESPAMRRLGSERLIKLESPEVVNCSDDIKPTPKEAAKLILKIHPPQAPNYRHHPYVDFVE